MSETYAKAFSLDPGRCFRFVATEQAKRQPIPGPGPVVASGRWRDGAGKVRVVEACEEHAVELDAVELKQPLPGRQILPQASTVGDFGLGIQAWWGREPFDRARVLECPWPRCPRVKPNQGFFTSTWDSEQQSSSWMQSESCRARGDEGRTVTLLRPAPDARIFVVESIEDFEKLAIAFPLRYPNAKLSPCPNWESLAKVVDGIHVTDGAIADPTDRYCGAWEVESTLWCRGGVLEVDSDRR